MADNVPLPASGVTAASDDIGGIQFPRVKLTIGADGVNDGDVSASNPMPMVGLSVNPFGAFTRPADVLAYAVGDLVAASTTAGNGNATSITLTRVAAGSASIRRVRLRKSGTAVTNAFFRVHFFNAQPTNITTGDNGVFASVVTAAANYVGAVDIATDQAFTDGAVGIGAPNIGGEILMKLPSGSAVFAMIEARAAYTPANAEVFTITLEAMQD